MLASGTEIGRYRIETLLGSGGMGEVYCAYDTLLRRRVALKVLRPDLPDAAARLLREGRAAAALSHPNAVAVFDVGEAAGMTFIAMELVLGKPMRDYIGDSMVPMPERVRWLVDLAHALGAAHQKGFVHRDIKPENVMICSDGKLKVLDFGIAKQAGVEAAAPTSIAQSAPSSYRTAEGRITGTPRYMSPEQLRGDPLDARTDEYSWGVVAYELLAGVHPLALTDGSRSPEMLNQRVPNMPFEIAAAVARAMAPAPELRFPTMAELAATLAPFVVAAAAPLAAPSSRATTATPQAATVDGSAPTGAVSIEQLRSSSFGARVHDAAGPFPRRLIFPAFCAIAPAVTITLFFVVMKQGAGKYVLAGAYLSFLFAFLVAWVRPMFELRREPRLARLSLERGVLRIEAGSWSQRLRVPAGASVVSLPHGASIAIARRRTFDPPIRIEAAQTVEATAILQAVGVPRSPHGVVRWPLGRGPLDFAAVSAGIGWRIGWPLIYIVARGGHGGIAMVIAAVASISTLLALLFRTLQPGPGPHLALTERGVDVRGEVVRVLAGRTIRVSAISVPLSVITSARAGSTGIEIDTTTGERIVVHAPPVRWSNRGLTAEEIALVAAHIEAAAAHARTGTFVAMLPANATIQGRHGAAG